MHGWVRERVGGLVGWKGEEGRRGCSAISVDPSQRMFSALPKPACGPRDPTASSSNSHWWRERDLQRNIPVPQPQSRHTYLCLSTTSGCTARGYMPLQRRHSQATAASRGYEHRTHPASLLAPQEVRLSSGVVLMQLLASIHTYERRIQELTEASHVKCDTYLRARAAGLKGEGPKWGRCCPRRAP